MELITYIRKGTRKKDITTHTEESYIVTQLYNTLFGKYIMKDRSITQYYRGFNYEDATVNITFKYSNGFVQEFRHVTYASMK